MFNAKTLRCKDAKEEIWIQFLSFASLLLRVFALRILSLPYQRPDVPRSDRCFGDDLSVFVDYHGRGCAEHSEAGGGAIIFLEQDRRIQIYFFMLATVPVGKHYQSRIAVGSLLIPFAQIVHHIDTMWTAKTPKRHKRVAANKIVALYYMAVKVGQRKF